MPGEIPDARFRLSHTFAIQPDLAVDAGPDRSILVGCNAEAAEAEAIFVGKHAEAPYRGVWMDVRGAHVLYVMGKRRSGKSYTLGAIAEGLVADNWVRQGSMKQGVLILDTMNVFLTMPYAVMETYSESAPAFQELRKWKIPASATPLTLITPSGRDLPGDLTGEGITLRASDLGIEEWCGLFEVDPFVDPMGHLITAIHSKIAREGVADRSTGQTIPPRTVFSLADMIAALDQDRDIQGFPRETREALRRRLEALGRVGLFGEQGLDVRRLLRPGHVSVLLLRDLDQELRAVMVSLIVKRMITLRALSEQQERVIPIHLAKAEMYASVDPQRAAAERLKVADCEQRAQAGLPRSCLIIDEAHNYIPARGTPPSRKPLVKYVNEGRNLGLSIVVATQQPSGLDPAIQRNADMLLVHALSHHDDIAAAQGMINTAVPDRITVDGKYQIIGGRSFEAMVRSLPIGYAIASTDRGNRLFPIRVRPRSTVHGGGDY